MAVLVDVGVGVSTGESVAVLDGVGVAASVAVVLGVGLGLTPGVWVGTFGTQSLSPTRIKIEFPIQFASCSMDTLTPNDWLRENSVSPGWMM